MGGDELLAEGVVLEELEGVDHEGYGGDCTGRLSGYGEDWWASPGAWEYLLIRGGQV